MPQRHHDQSLAQWPFHATQPFQQGLPVAVAVTIAVAVAIASSNAFLTANYKRPAKINDCQFDAQSKGRSFQKSILLAIGIVTIYTLACTAAVYGQSK